MKNKLLALCHDVIRDLSTRHKKNINHHMQINGHGKYE